MKMLLRRMLDEAEFLSPYGVRALSKYHEAHPYVLDVGGAAFSIGYEPGEGTTTRSAATPTGAARCGCRSTSC